MLLAMHRHVTLGPHHGPTGMHVQVHAAQRTQRSAAPRMHAGTQLLTFRSATRAVNSAELIPAPTDMGFGADGPEPSNERSGMSKSASPSSGASYGVFGSLIFMWP